MLLRRWERQGVELTSSSHRSQPLPPDSPPIGARLTGPLSSPCSRPQRLQYPPHHLRRPHRLHRHAPHQGTRDREGQGQSRRQAFHPRMTFVAQTREDGQARSCGCDSWRLRGDQEEEGGGGVRGEGRCGVGVGERVVEVAREGEEVSICAGKEEVEETCRSHLRLRYHARHHAASQQQPSPRNPPSPTRPTSTFDPRLGRLLLFNRRSQGAA